MDFREWTKILLLLDTKQVIVDFCIIVTDVIGTTSSIYTLDVNTFQYILYKKEK